MAFLGWGLAMAAEGPVASKAGLEWHRFPDQTKFEVRGLPWFEANQPRFWRLPAAGFETLPKGVQNRAKVPSGGRIRLRSDTTRLVLRAATAGGGLVNRLDVLVGSELRRAVSATKVGDGTELVLFEAMPRVERDITVYLPHRQDIVVTAVGVDPGARFSPVQAGYSRAWPVVYYGSSVCEGNGASGAGLTYPADLGRQLNLDFVNLGFGGAGKAEPEVVKLVSSQPACAYVFDLGKSYGNQDAAAFRTMLQRVRREHPEVPLLVITPITSVREVNDPAYSERSVHVRRVMREAARELIASGDRRVWIVEGEALLGFQEHAQLSRDGVHPADRGYASMAAKLAPVLRQMLAP